MIKHVAAAVREGEPVPEAVLVEGADHVCSAVAVAVALEAAEPVGAAERVAVEERVAVAEHVARFTEEPAGHSEGQPQGVGAPAPVGQ